MKSRMIPLVILVLGIVLRLAFLNFKVLHLDELPDVVNVVFPSSSLRELASNYFSSGDSHAFPYRALLLLSQMLFGKREIAYIIPSLLAGVGEVWLTYHLVRRWADERVASYASFFVATSFMHLFFSTGVRSYPFYYCAAILLLSLVGSTNRVATSVAVLGVLSSHYASIFLVGCLLVYFGYQNSKLRLPTVALTVAGALGAIFYSGPHAPRLDIRFPDFFWNALESMIYPWIYESYRDFDPAVLLPNSPHGIWYLLVIAAQLIGLRLCFARHRLLAFVYIASVAFDSVDAVYAHEVVPQYLIYKDALIFFMTALSISALQARLTKLGRPLGYAVAASTLATPLVLLARTDLYSSIINPRENLFVAERVRKDSSAIIACVAPETFSPHPFNLAENVRYSNLLYARFRGATLIQECQCDRLSLDALGKYQFIYFVSTSRGGAYREGADRCFIGSIGRKFRYLESHATPYFEGDYSISAFLNPARETGG